jgi:hypothetical protein
MTNSIIDEVRQARAEIAAEHGYDIQRIYEWAREAHAARQKSLRAQAGPKKIARKKLVAVP